MALILESLDVKGGPIKIYRAKVPGGWLVIHTDAMVFIADPDHEWDGSSLP